MDSSTSRQYGGSGLGLSICRHLVSRMNGTIGVESMPGRGSDFRFTLPLKSIRRVGSSPTLNINKATTPMSVLVVDNHPVNQRVLKHMIEELGHNSIEMPSTSKETWTDTTQQVDVVLLDLTEQNATDIVPDLRAANITAPIIAVADPDQEHDPQKFGSLKLSGFLTRPISALTLSRVLSAMHTRAA